MSDLRTWLEQDQERTQQEAAAQWRSADLEAQAKRVGRPLPLRHFIAAHDQRLVAEIARRARQQADEKMQGVEGFDMYALGRKTTARALREFADSLDQARGEKT